MGLRKFNLIMAAVHALQGFAILALSKDFSLPVSGSFLSFNQVTRSLEPANTELFNISLPILIVGFLFLSAVAHLVIATVYNKQYNSDLSKGLNKARWIEYALSASTMMIPISMSAVPTGRSSRRR